MSTTARLTAICVELINAEEKYFSSDNTCMNKSVANKPNEIPGLVCMVY